MTEFSGEQTHPASPIRQEQARRDGDIPKSLELANAIHLLGALAVAFILIRGVASWVRNWTITQWQEAGTSVALDAEGLTNSMQTTIYSLAAILTPALALMLFLGFLSHWSQTGVVFRPQQSAPDVTRLGPGKWWRHVFSMNSIAIPFIGLPKTLIAGLTAVASCWIQHEQVFGLGALPIEQLVESMFGLVLAVGFHVALVLLVLSLGDFAIKRWSFERRIRMTEQQLRDEVRMQNGDPTVNTRRRHVHRSYGRGATEK